MGRDVLSDKLKKSRARKKYLNNVKDMHNLYSRSNKSNNINSLIIPMRFFAILLHFLAVIIASANPSVRIESQQGGDWAGKRLKGGL